MSDMKRVSDSGEPEGCTGQGKQHEQRLCGTQSLGFTGEGGL